MNTFRVLVLLGAFSLAGLGSLSAQTYDISSGGTPTITGARGGSVVGNSSTTTDLAVTINFGEVSPINTNSIVKVIVPIAVRSLSPYKVTATVSGPINGNAQAIQRTDIGFGANNMRTMGFLSRNCTNSDHIFASPFNLDPSTNVTILPSGRVSYPGDLNDLTTSPTILSGPALSFLTAGRFTFNGYVFDAIIVITPQFYAAGNASATVTFTISAGPNVPC